MGGSPLLAPEGVSTMMGHSRDFLLTSRFNWQLYSLLEEVLSFIQMFIYRASRVQGAYEIQGLKVLGVEAT